MSSPAEHRAPTAASFATAALLGALASGCFTFTQKAMRPLPPVGDQETAARKPAPGGPETTVVRHSDPVYIQRPGSVGAYPLAWYRKRERVVVGTTIRTGAGGRAELVWPGDASSVLMFGQGTLTLGDPDRDEPLIRLIAVGSVRLLLTPEDRVELLGGAILRGDPAEPSGPFLVSRISAQLFRVTNQSLLDARIAFREDVLELSAGDSIDLPILAVGSAPESRDPSQFHLESSGIAMDVLGELEPPQAAGPGALLLRARSQSQIDALGIRLHLEPGDEAVLSDLGNSSGGPSSSSVEEASTGKGDPVEDDPNASP